MFTIGLKFGVNTEAVKTILELNENDTVVEV